MLPSTPVAAALPMPEEFPVLYPSPSARLADRHSFRDKQLGLHRSGPLQMPGKQRSFHMPSMPHMTMHMPKLHIASPMHRSHADSMEMTMPVAPFRTLPRPEPMAEPKPVMGQKQAAELQPTMKTVLPMMQPETHKWTWEDWAHQSSRDMATVSRGLEMIAAGIGGGLTGVTIAMLPMFTKFGPMIEYSFVIPAAATGGVLAGYFLVFKRWTLRKD